MKHPLSLRLGGLALVLGISLLLSFSAPLPFFSGVLARADIGANGMEFELQMKGHVLAQGTYAIGVPVVITDPTGLFLIEAEVLSADPSTETAQIRAKVEFTDPVLGGVWEGVNEVPFGRFYGSYGPNYHYPSPQHNFNFDARARFAVYADNTSKVAMEVTEGTSCDFLFRGSLNPLTPSCQAFTPCHGDFYAETIDFTSVPPLTHVSLTNGPFDDFVMDAQLPYGLYVLGYRNN